MTSEHYTPEVVATILATDDRDDRMKLSRHARECVPCASALAAAEAFARHATSGASGSAIEKLKSAAQAMNREDDQARLAIEEALEQPEGAARRAALKALPQTAEVVRRLAALCRRHLDSDPVLAMDLGSSATKIGESLRASGAADALTATAIGDAWKEIAHVHRYGSRYDDALEALDRAEEAYRLSRAPHFDVAVVNYVRALIFRERGQLEEALDLLGDAGAVFRDHGDDTRSRDVAMVVAAVAFSSGDFARARSEFEALLDGASDPLTVAQLHNNIGHCSVQLGEIDSAFDHFRLAAETFYRDGRTVQAAKAEWGIARLHLNRGWASEAASLLRPLRDRFVALGMLEEAGLVSLDLARSLFAIGEHAEAERMVRRVSEDFEGAGLDRRAVEALRLLSSRIEEPLRAMNNLSRVVAYLEDLRQGGVGGELVLQ